MTRIPESKWRWFGNAGHLIVGHDCRFHFATHIGDYLVSTVGEYLPDSTSWPMYAESKGVTLTGRGDDLRAQFLREVGYIELGYKRTFETMVFKAGAPCTCGCGIPEIDGHELGADGYNDAAAATKGHYIWCGRAARGVIVEEEGE